MQLAITVQVRGGARRRCALCRDVLAWPEVRCEGCGVLVHQECGAWVTRCPSLGCAGSVSPPVVSFERRVGRWCGGLARDYRRRRGLLLGWALLLGVLLTLVLVDRGPGPPLPRKPPRAHRSEITARIR